MLFRSVEVLDRIHRGDDGRVEYHFVIADFLCTPTAGTMAAGSDAADAQWVPAADLDAFRLAPKARDVVAKAFELARRS